MFQKLRFGYTWVSHKKDIDVSSDFHTITHFFGDSSYKKEQKSFLDLLHAMNLRSYRIGKVLENLFVGGEFFFEI